MENKLINTGQNSIMDNFIETDDILKDMRQIIESSQKAAHQAVNMTLVQRNWMMGYRIASEELHGEKRAEYGTKIIGRLGSGDVWNQEKDRIKWISKVCNTLCEDMESASIYTICNDMNIPVIGIRIISNNELKNLEFEKSTEINCQKFVYEMIKKIINQG